MAGLGVQVWFFFLFVRECAGCVYVRVEDMKDDYRVGGSHFCFVDGCCMEVEVVVYHLSMKVSLCRIVLWCFSRGV